MPYPDRRELRWRVARPILVTGNVQHGHAVLEASSGGRSTGGAPRRVRPDVSQLEVEPCEVFVK